MNADLLSLAREHGLDIERTTYTLVCCLVKLEEFAKRGGHCNSTVIPSFHVFLFTFFFLFSEIGELLCMKSRYGPGGRFEPDWYVLLLSVI